MIHKSGWHHVAIYALLIAVVMLGLAFYLNDPICRNSASCVLMGVLGAAVAEILLIASFAIFNARQRAKSIGELIEMARQISTGENRAPILSSKRR